MKKLFKKREKKSIESHVNWLSPVIQAHGRLELRDGWRSKSFYHQAEDILWPN